MADTVLITTHDLESAVRLRDGFADEGTEVELLTSTERIADVTDPVLLILTGGLEEKRSARLVREAFERDRLPVIALASAEYDASPEGRRRLGASEVFRKPIDVSEVVLIARRLMARRRLQEVTGIVGETDAMTEVLEKVVQIAPVNSTVLVTGESGTGKELVARGLHALSPRRHRPFIAANVAAMADTLVESELFGHEKGAFTGAIAQRKGLFELAHRGTLFLDEIGEMPHSTQSKLLRVLETREFMRVGGEEPIQVDVRVVAATNQDLRQQAELGNFRRDLYYRLNVLHVRLPALRERREDIPVLVRAFIRRASFEHDRPEVAISPEAMSILMDYAWPGNVRELRNLVESMVVLSPGRVIQPDDIPAGMRSSYQLVLPAPIARPSQGGPGAPPQELEFIFRTLLQLRIDVEELRHHFDDFRRANPDIQTASYAAQLGSPAYAAPAAGPVRINTPIHIEDAIIAQPRSLDGPGAIDDDDDEDGSMVVFRKGMTMEDLEREAITSILKEVHGNRRKAAELLGIGERTLYRKIKEYGIPL